MATKWKRIFAGLWLVVVTAVLILMVTSCRPKPPPTLVETVTPIPEPIIEPSPNATVVSMLTAVPEENSMAEPTPQPTATEEKCGLPEGWVVYQIRPGDTLLSLANATSTTVDTLKSVNCLLTDDIIAGETLFLPYLPPAPPPAPAVPQSVPATEEPDECASPFSCPDPDIVDTLMLDPGAGNDPDFVPCQNVTQPRLELDSTTKVIMVGQRRFIYVCVPNPTSATVTDESGQTKPVEGLLSSMPNPDLILGDASAVIDWPVLPMEPTGVHTMTVTYPDGPPVNFRFLVTPPDGEQILVVPLTRSPGESFTVYYVNFPLTDSLPIDFWGEEEPTVSGTHSLRPHAGWTVAIDQTWPGVSDRGWGQMTLNSLVTDQPAGYSISYDNKRVTALFWLK